LAADGGRWIAGPTSFELRHAPGARAALVVRTHGEHPLRSPLAVVVGGTRLPDVVVGTSGEAAFHETEIDLGPQPQARLPITLAVPPSEPLGLYHVFLYAR
jgi:hypothetical protein